MPHVSGKKIADNHTTAIDAAMPIIKEAEKLACVSKISLGIITQAKNSRGRTSIKIEHQLAGLQIKVRGNTSIQELWIYTNDKDQCEKAFSALIN